jgi:hypothetical protein
MKYCQLLMSTPTVDIKQVSPRILCLSSGYAEFCLEGYNSV